MVRAACALVLLAQLCCVFGSPLESYASQRKKLLQSENDQALGGHLEFLSGESVVNDQLMKCKRAELEKGMVHPSEFGPAKNFLDSKWSVENSTVFKMIKEMPKGGVLHAHSTAIVSDDFIFNNITYRSNLYACDPPEKLVLRFFDKPEPKSCPSGWKLVKDLRSNPQTEKIINERIKKSLSMIDRTQAKSIYADGNAAWKKFEDIFKFVGPMLKYRPVHEDHFYQGLKELYEDNVLYLELRAGLGSVYELDGTVYSPVEVAKLFKTVSDRFVRDHPDFVGVKLIFAPAKTNDPARFEGYLKTVAQLRKELPDFFVGFDLVGQEDGAPTLFNWVEKLHTIANDVPFFFHAGETNWYGLDVDENLLDAVLLNAKRIGHGYALMKHPRVVELVKQRKIAIEVCPISNQVLGLVTDLRNHPASALFVDDFPVVVSNDDPGLWGAKALSYDFYETFMGIMSAHSDLRAIKQLASNSIRYSSLNPAEKQKAFQIWERKWDAYVRSHQEKH